MKVLVKIIVTLIIIPLLLLQLSCVSFNPGWISMEDKTLSSHIGDLLEKAHTIESTADTKDELIELIRAFKDVEKADPHNYYALWKIGNYNILMGSAFTTKIKDKKYYYKEAISYCEKAMCTNYDFLTVVKKGEKVTDAADRLTINEIDAMGYWYTARFYYFKDCLKPLGRVMNTKIVIQNNAMIDRIDELDPTWAGGGNFFSRGLYYIAVPEKFGGSKQRAADEFEEAIRVGPDYLVNRWGRAKYLYYLIGNDDAARSDLEWVVKQDPHECGNTYPWNVYFQKDAANMLAEK